MTCAIILPALVESITDKCVASINVDLLDNLYIVDNSQHGFAKKYGVAYEHHPENIGVSRAWNIGAHKVVDEKLDYLVILSSSIIFNKGMLDLDDIMKQEQQAGIYTQHGWHLIVLSREIFERIGFFDENFYPAYFEDTDFIRRMELAGIHHPVAHSPRLYFFDVDADLQGTALGLKSGVPVNFGALNRYFIRKWGNDSHYASQNDRDKLYQHPFNDSNKSLDYWEKHTVNQLKEMYRV